MGKYIDKKFIDRLEILRGDSSKSAFAAACGINSVTMLGYLNGNSSPSLEKLRQIAESQGVTVGWLVDDETIISNSTGNHQIVTGNGIVTAGGKITGSVQVREQTSQKMPMEEFLDEEELSLITMIRDLGGPRIIKRFKEELKRIQKIIDGE